MANGDMGRDFLELEDDENGASTSRPDMSSHPGVQNSMPRFNMQLKRKGATNSAAPPAAAKAEGFIASPRGNLLFFSPLTSPEQHRRSFRAQAPPVRSPASRSAAEITPGDAVAPLTIFYNGTVTTFNLPRDQAEAIINLAERTTPGVRRTERPTVTFDGAGTGRQLQPSQPFALDKLGGGGDLPLARKRSLQRFLEKRKEK